MDVDLDLPIAVNDEPFVEEYEGAVKEYGAGVIFMSEFDCDILEVANVEVFAMRCYFVTFFCGSFILSRPPLSSPSHFLSANVIPPHFPSTPTMQRTILWNRLFSRYLNKWAFIQE